MSQHSQMGRFDQSFIFHMIRDFFLVLIVVVCVELGVRFFLVVYDFEMNGKPSTVSTAERLASDLKSIMLNSGGPVAARTVYPILKRNHSDLGVEIAITPSPLTVTSMQTMFDFTPQGIPSNWPEGKHHEHTVDLKAEQFCLSCHIDGQIGSVLGSVTVRTYLSDKLTHWWHEVQLTAMMMMFNIIIHTVVLFLLLRLRMEPLMSLHATVSTLAKGIINLSFRATVKTHDEFGQLALDLNHFLDRIEQIIEDLRHILQDMVATNGKFIPLSEQIDQQIESIYQQTQSLTKSAVDCHKVSLAFPKEKMETLHQVSSLLEKIQADSNLSELSELEAKTDNILKEFREALDHAEKTFQFFDQLSHHLVNLSEEVHGLSRSMEDMAIFEEKMQAAVQLGEALLKRLRGD